METISLTGACLYVSWKVAMKATISITISNTVNEDGIVPKQFDRTSELVLDLPSEYANFTESVEMMTSTSLTGIILGLYTKVTKLGQDYVDEARKSGIRQLELPLNDRKPADAGADEAQDVPEVQE